MPYRVMVPPDIEKQISKLHPLLKAKIRAGFDDLSSDPYQGKPLREELSGLHSYRVSRYRIVYRIHQGVCEIYVVGVGSRKTIYQLVVAQETGLKS